MSNVAPELPPGLPPPGGVLAGKYRIERVLGVGGMGIVLEAVHVHLGEKVAIKCLLGEYSRDPGRVTRFSREAWAAAKIKSDHVTRVSDVAALDDGTPYLVMEFLEGADLEQTLRHGALPLADAVDYILQACEALAEAHKLGIVHRDLKPGNLFLTWRADGSPWIKVLDFGISKVSAAGNITKTSALMGSPLYMAPEQLASSKYVDARADIWALGVILYELTTRALPFVGDTIPQVCTAVLHAEPRPLSDVAPHLPRELEQVLQRCLAKHPDHRYPSLAELALALAPLGGANAAQSAEFICRVLGTAPRASLPSIPRATVPSAPTVQQPPLVPPGKATAATFSRTVHTTRLRAGWIVGAAALVLLAGGTLAVFAIRDSAARAVAPQHEEVVPAVGSEPEPASVAPEAEAPEPSAASSASAAASAPSAAASASAAPAPIPRPLPRAAPPPSPDPFRRR